MRSRPPQSAKHRSINWTSILTKAAAATAAAAAAEVALNHALNHFGVLPPADYGMGLVRSLPNSSC